MNIDIEIKFDDETTEFCKIIKRFRNGDYELDRKKRRRIELESPYDVDYLRFKYKDKYVWVNAYLKDTKGYDQVLIRRIEV
ncbi:hypothetical protein [Metabacillus fastidiosus]|uniref:hypothetical protein n=1 Tax=Metabacillus fastidiosus TaxID=1458 RepID=UPI003D270941